MIICGIDYSYTSPAVCIYDTKKDLKFDNLMLFNMNSVKKTARSTGNIDIRNFPSYETQEERFNNIFEWSSGLLKQHKVESVNIEGYSYGSTSGFVFDIAENTSLLKNYMWKNKIPFEVHSPSKVKKSFTGKGNAKKEIIIEQFHNRFPNIGLHNIIGVKENQKPLDDICDSCAIMLCDKFFLKD